MVKSVKTAIIIICNILLVLTIFKVINYIDLYNKRTELMYYQQKYDELTTKINNYKTILVNYEIMNTEEEMKDSELIDKYNKLIDELTTEINNYDVKIKELDQKIQNS